MTGRLHLRSAGFTLIELLVTMMIGSVLIMGVTNVLGRTLEASDVAHTRNELIRQSRFALQTIAQVVSQADEDWDESVVFYLSSNRLIQRVPVTWDDDASEHIEEILATHVTDFNIERSIQNGNRGELVAITLQLSSPEHGIDVRLETQLRLGSRL